MTEHSRLKTEDASPAGLKSVISDALPLSSQRTESGHFDHLPPEIQGILENASLNADEKLDKLWKAFETHAREPEIARYLVDTMQFIKPTNKGQMVERIEAGLHHGSYDDGVRRSLVNLLASQFEHDASITSTTEWQLPGNPLVLASLRKAANSGDHATAHQAVLQYSRLGEAQDSISLLNTARSNGTINTNEYVKEISFHLPLIVDPAQQQHLLGLMENSGLPGQDLAEILATTAQLPHALSSLAPDSLHTIRRILDTNPPTFASDLLDLDVLALAQYNRWAGASSTITHALSGEPVPDLLTALVMYPGADPRALIAVAASPMSESVMQALTERGLANDALRQLDRFQLASGNTAEASGIVADIRMRLENRSNSRIPLPTGP
ncbi:hypothetical protein [Cupriavidus necator]|uniref:hypothetical protein n=1 Tax=Cupriavidus necator TaxID=106590 RepID=UPI000F507200|nr:hypothetical protein [Cupriavidus necator]